MTEAGEDDARAGPLLAAPARMLAKPGTSFFAHPISGRNSMTPPESDSPDEDSLDDNEDDDMSVIDDTVYTAKFPGKEVDASADTQQLKEVVDKEIYDKEEISSPKQPSLDEIIA